MSEKLQILLIEDNRVDAEGIREQLKETMKKLIQWELTSKMEFDEIDVQWVEGSERTERRGKKVYNHYTEDDINVIRQNLIDMKKGNNHVGILLDVILTKEEQDYANMNDLSKLAFSRRLMDSFEAEFGIYLITTIRNFGSRAWKMFGRENMERRYVPKELVLDYHSKKAMATALYWMYHKKEIPEGLAKEIENKELELN